VGKLLLLGYFGAGNLGDDGFVVDFLKRWEPELRRRLVQCDYTAAGEGNPLDGFLVADELRELLGAALSRIRILFPPDYEALVVPGGSLLQNATSMRSLLFYLHVISRFARAGVPVYMLGQGLGPFKGRLADPLTIKTLKQVRLITLRDQQSLEWATGRMQKEILLSSDPLLAGRLQPLQEMRDYSYAGITPKLTEPYYDIRKQAHALMQLLKEIKELGLGCWFKPMHDDDRGLMKAMSSEIPASHRVLEKSGSPDFPKSKLLGLLSSSEFVVSYRLHGLILAAAYGVPGLGVAYDPKVSAFCEEMGLPYCTPQDVIDGKAIELVRDLWHNREQVKATMIERRAVALKRLEAAEARFGELLWGGR
jgi:polysaccharide pyruvyl transferase CsaB